MAAPSDEMSIEQKKLRIINDVPRLSHTLHVAIANILKEHELGPIVKSFKDGIRLDVDLLSDTVINEIYDVTVNRSRYTRQKAAHI